MSGFVPLGFFKEFYINNKFIGQVECEKDRDEIGYAGKQNVTLSEPIELSNGKKIKANTSVMTVIYPLCGKKL